MLAAGLILIFWITCLGGEPTAPIPWDRFEQIDADGGLLPSYGDVMRRPLEYFGISIWSGPEDGGGYMGALADPAVIESGGVNVFAETEVVETLDDYRELAGLGINFLPFTHTLFSPTADQHGFYTYDKVKEVIAFLEEKDVPITAYFGLANHPGFPIFTLDYARQDPTRFQRGGQGKDVYRLFPMRTVLNPALSWEHPDLAQGALESAAHHAADWREFSNIPFWCLMGENLFADEEGDFSEAHRRHFAAWLERRYGSEEELQKAWGRDSPVHFADVPSPAAVTSPTPTLQEIDAARFRRESMAELYRAVRGSVRSADPGRLALGLFHGSANRPRELVRMGVHPDRIATLDPQEVAVLFGEAVLPKEWDLERELTRLESQLASSRERGFRTASSRKVLLFAQDYLAAGRRTKALAGLLRVRRSLLVDLQVDSANGGAAVLVKVASVGHALPETAAVELRLPDHADVRVQLAKTSENQWTGNLRRDEQLGVYDYDAGRYAPDRGPVAVQAEARAGAYAGASPVVLWKATPSQ